MIGNTIKGIHLSPTTGRYRIPELEVSITNSCHLRCDNCGFCIPEQPSPTIGGDVVAELASGISHLARMNISVGSVAVLGGEPTFSRPLLDRALVALSAYSHIEQTEVVTHGLTPQNLSMSSLQRIDKLSISVYFDSDELIEYWRTYLHRFAPHLQFCARRDQDWDRWSGPEVVDAATAQGMYDRCWYRKHCVTLERGTLFLCSRIAKLARDGEGLKLSDSTRVDDVVAYLNRKRHLPACRSCTPMMGLPTVTAGVQPDDRVAKLVPRAIDFLATQLHEAT